MPIRPVSASACSRTPAPLGNREITVRLAMVQRVVAIAAIAAAVTMGTGCSTTPTTPTGPAPVLTKVSPTSAAIGDTITITGTGFTATGNTVKLGSGYTAALNSSTTTTLTFTVPSALGVCAPTAQACVALALTVSPGATTLAVLNSNGTSNELAFTVVAK